MSGPRVASLLPSTTEIVCALGLRDRLVGRSHECDFPEGLDSVPVLTAPKLDVSKPSLEIDRDVRTLVRDGLSIYRVDAERLRALAPDVILTQTHCEVCAVTPKDVEAAVADWLGARPEIVSLEPATLGDVWADMIHVANALGVLDAGHALAARLANRITDVAERAMRLRERPRIACIEWIEPLMAAGNWMPELVTLAGGRAAFGETGAHSPWITLEALRDADPDVIAVMPCGFDLPRTRLEIEPLLAATGFGELRAVRSGRVALTDGNAYFNRPGPRLVESLQILAEIAHPDVFAPSLRGAAWVPLALRGT